MIDTDRILERFMEVLDGIDLDAVDVYFSVVDGKPQISAYEVQEDMEE